MIGATAGLGFLINYAQYNFLIPKMYAAILTTSLLGVAVNYGLVALERRFSRWRPPDDPDLPSTRSKETP